MAKDEVELGGEDAGDDYEVVPVGPIRKLERRIDEMEEKAQQNGAGGTNDELVRDVLDIMKSNQKIVNDMTESTHELKNSVEDLTHKMDSVIDNMNSFMDLLQEASEMDMEGEMVSDVQGQIVDAIDDRMRDVADEFKESNQELVTHLEEINKSLKRSYASESKDNILRGSDSKQQSQGNQSQRGMGVSQRNQDQAGMGSRARRSQQSSGAEAGQEAEGSQLGGSSRDGSQRDRLENLRQSFGNKSGRDEQ